MEKVVWGIIGCGDVAEVKSGPAFQKIANSELLAVMRRNAKKAKDFAKRHQVPFSYDSVEALLGNPKINAVYIATPPSSHLEITLKAIEAGKNIYLEKPITLSVDEAKTVIKALKKSNSKLTVAHYRRKLPAFLKVKSLLEDKAIGEVSFADIQILQSSKPSLVANSEENWRLQPRISGGGYFHDLAPHHLDLMYYLFGEIDKAKGFSVNQGKKYPADDVVNGIISFKDGVQFRGLWSFNVAEELVKDCCTIYGSQGSIEFSFFGGKVKLKLEDKTETFLLTQPPHVQQPMIEATVDYFLGQEPNPCPAEEGLLVMELMDKFCN